MVVVTGLGLIRKESNQVKEIDCFEPKMTMVVTMVATMVATTVATIVVTVNDINFSLLRVVVQN